MKPNSQLSNRAVNVLAKSGLPATDALRGLVADALRQGTTPLGRPLILMQGCGAKTFSEICQWAGVALRDARAARFSDNHCCQWLRHEEALLLDKLCARTGKTREELFKHFAADPLPVRADLQDTRQQAAAFATVWLQEYDPTLLLAYPAEFQARVAYLSEFAADYLSKR